MATAAPPIAFTTGHVGLNVSDLERAKRFYQQVFGFEVAAESAEPGRAFVFLRQDQTLVLTLWPQSGGAFAADRPGLHHLSFQVDSVAQVEAVEARLRALGARIHHGGVVAHVEGAASGGLFFEDPDGIRLEVFTAALADAHGASAHGGAPHGAAPTCGFF